MKKILVCFTLIASLAFASTTKDDLLTILEKTYLEEHCEPLLNMIAVEAITESGREVESTVLVDQFRKHFSDEAVIAKFSVPYQSSFTDEEIAELRKIYDSPVWSKYSKIGMRLIEENLKTMKETFIELAAVFPEAEKSVVAVVPADILQITTENDAEIAKSKLPVILDINASWCNPCRMMNPIIDEMSAKYDGKIQFAKIDYDSQSELVKKYGVTALPTILFIQPGKDEPVMKSVGYVSKKDFEAKIEEFLKK
ncbi:MAG: hypothetical protein COT85_00250 [Chlamydiae bacterium CG10_big_fil_rev_8_21_14_0_10_42_34]|nr:MAG: hypothetical protein COT85_00250 [Chlamydiae bacterium CG10_big_fil_rev_8_21_14_0_10_42_34]